MGIASLLSIKVTSPITHMVSSAVRGVAASFLGVWLFHDIITTYAVANLFVMECCLPADSLTAAAPHLLPLSSVVRYSIPGLSISNRKDPRYAQPAPKRMSMSVYLWMMWKQAKPRVSVINPNKSDTRCIIYVIPL